MNARPIPGLIRSLADIETNDPEERFNVFFEWFWAGPLTRVGDAGQLSAGSESG